MYFGLGPTQPSILPGCANGEKETPVQARVAENEVQCRKKGLWFISVVVCTAEVTVQVKEHNRKQRRDARRNPLSGKKISKDPGIPNMNPFKDKILTQVKKSCGFQNALFTGCRCKLLPNGWRPRTSSVRAVPMSL